MQNYYTNVLMHVRYPKPLFLSLNIAYTSSASSNDILG